ncbi:MAG: PAS domain-containing protein [Bacteriovorax sp.]|nr:PAS domain-containing protein [Bacteriovorax sp.]
MLESPNLFDQNLPKEFQNIFLAIDHCASVAITNTKGEITYVNDKFCEISKYAREELIGQNHRLIKSGHHPDRFFKELWNTISSGQIWAGEIKNRAKDGGSYWVFNTITPCFHEDGTPSLYVSIRFDITEKKIFEEKMNMLKIDLDQTMIERDIREQFLSTLSHDLRTPLTIAKISAQIIEKKDSVTDKIKNLTIKITENINRVDTLIMGLLDNNKNRTQDNFFPDYVELDMLEFALETLENLATIHGDRFKVEASGNLKGHWCSLGLKRILENLATNAIKYGDATTPVIIKIKDINNQVVLSVHNQGNPISEADQKIIFDYFQRTASAELGTQDGWGLGLTAVKAMAMAHGGSVRVFSFPGDEGTTFTVTLPRDSRLIAQEKALQCAHSFVVNECENLLRLFRHMSEIIVILSGPLHRFEFVNEAYIETFGINATGMSVRELGPSWQNNLPILDAVYSSGLPRKLTGNPIIIDGQFRYLNQTFVPRKNKSGNIIGILSISSEVTLEA